MIRPTEIWRPRLERADSRAALHVHREFESGEASAPASDGTTVQLPLPSFQRDLTYIWQFLRTSLPLWIADQLSIVLVIVAASAVLSVAMPWQTLGIGLGLAFTLVNYCLQMYPGIGLCAQSEFKQTSTAAALICVVHGLLVVVPGNAGMAYEWPVLCIYLGCAALMPMARRFARRFACRFAWWGQPALVFGNDEYAAAAFGALLKHPQLGLHPVGLVERLHLHSPNCETAGASWFVPDGQPLLNSDLFPVYWGVVAMPDSEAAESSDVVDQLALALPHILFLPPQVRCGRQWFGAHRWGDLNFARIDVRLLLPGQKLLKRLLDLTLTAVVLILAIPLLILVAVLLKLTSPGPSFYRHERIGLGGRRFRAWKFRTMRIDAERILKEHLVCNPELMAEWDATHKLKRDPRVTGIGWFLRKVSLDELPQLWNVIVGDMSLVGPRPIVQAEVSKYEDMFRLYCRTRPGITGLWQINGRNNTTYAQRISYDTQYVRNWSPWLDCYILIRTIKTVLLTEGAY